MQAQSLPELQNRFKASVNNLAGLTVLTFRDGGGEIMGLSSDCNIKMKKEHREEKPKNSQGL